MGENFMRENGELLDEKNFFMKDKYYGGAEYG